MVQMVDKGIGSNNNWIVKLPCLEKKMVLQFGATYVIYNV